MTWFWWSLRRWQVKGPGSGDPAGTGHHGGVSVLSPSFPLSADHRHFSLHVHHPLSKPPADSRRKRISEGRKEGRRGTAPNTAATIEEDHEEDEGEEESYSHNDEEEGRTTTPTR